MTTKSAIEQLKGNLKSKKQLLEDWYKSKAVDKKPYIEDKDCKTNNVKHKTISLILDSMALIQGMSDANESLKYDFDIHDASLDIKEIIQLSKKLFRIKILELSLDNLNMDKSDKERIKSRFIDRQFPTDNHNTADNKLSRVVNKVFKEVQPDRAVNGL